MAKVEGSNPFIRFLRIACKSAGFGRQDGWPVAPQIVAGTTREYQTRRVVDARARAETRAREGSSVDLDLSRGFEIVQTRRGSRLSSTQTPRRRGRVRSGNELASHPDGWPC